MKTRDVIAIAVPTLAFSIAAILFLYMAATREDPWHLAAAVGCSVAAVLGVIQWSRLDKRQNA